MAGEPNPTAPSGERHFGAKSEMQLAEEATGQFRYLLNAMEFAAQSDEPAKLDYYGKRLAVMQHVASLSTERARMERERDDARGVWRLAITAEAGYQKEISRLTSELDRVRGALTEVARLLALPMGAENRIEFAREHIEQALGVTPDATTRREG